MLAVFGFDDCRVPDDGEWVIMNSGWQAEMERRMASMDSRGRLWAY